MRKSGTSRPLEEKQDHTFLMRLVLCLIGLATILPLIGYLHGIIRMNVAAVTLLLPAVGIYLIAYLWSRKHSSALRHRFERGFAGGLLGVAGYDLIRVPFHLGGLNPFAAIQSYGIYLADADRSSFFTDWLGLIYHTGNGIFFGIMFTLIVSPGRATALLALVWALVLEGLAVATAFGAVYHLRSNPTGMSVAFFAHLFYGAPLAWFATRPTVRRWAFAGSAVAAFVAIFCVWILVRPPDGYLASGGPSTLQLVEKGPHPKWSKIALSDTFLIQNASGEKVMLEYPFSDRKPDELNSGSTIEINFPKPGIYQIRAQRTDWRSVLVVVEKDGFVNPRTREE